MAKKVIFRVEYGGLGDHLFYSALPRLLKERKIADEVYIASNSNFRNPQIFDLVWKNNPHLDGISDEAPTSTLQISNSTQTKIVNRIFEQYGIESDIEIPVEVYQPVEVKPHLVDKYIDLNYVSYVGAFAWFDKFKLYLQYPDHVMINPDRLATIFFPGRKKVFTRSLMDYAQRIAASSAFVTLASGGATLAAALNKPSTVYYGHGQNPVFHHAMHQYLRVGGTHWLRYRLGRFLEKRNTKRIKRAKNK